MLISLQVSYSVTSQLADKYFKFYRSLPSDILVNSGRLALMYQFEWIRIGILYSAGAEYIAVSSYCEHFRTLNLEYRRTFLWRGETIESEFFLLRRAHFSRLTPLAVVSFSTI